MSQTKLIKKYSNRKLYDVDESKYVNFDQIMEMIKADTEVVVVDNKTKQDITAATLTRVIYEYNNRTSSFAPLSDLRESIVRLSKNAETTEIKS